MEATLSSEKVSLLDTDQHQIVLNSTGEKTGVLIPFDQYEEIMLKLQSLVEYAQMEKRLHFALDDMYAMKSGKLPRRNVMDLLDED